MIFRISILINIIFLLGYFWNWINTPSYEIGRLEKDIEIGRFSSDSTIFKIPKGITVRNASQRGLNAIGQFENERFEIVITSDDQNLVNYDLPKDSLQVFQNLYSADVHKYSKKDTFKIPQGKLEFKLQYSEFGERMNKKNCQVIIDGKKVIVKKYVDQNSSNNEIILEGILIKHKSGNWIIGEKEEDKNAEEIGGCTGGPVLINFETKIIELC